MPLDRSANCVVGTGRRGGTATTAACLVLATDRTDVHGVLRRHLDVRKMSCAATDVATASIGMEYGGITLLGMPDGWPIPVDPG